MVDLSIIIISFNTKKYTFDCIKSITDSLKNPSFTYEVVVWDNASTDGTIEILKKAQAENQHIRLLESKENIGFGRGNNRAAEKAKGAHLLFLNSDTLVLDNAVEKLYRFYRDHEQQAQFVGGKLFNTDKTEQSSAGSFFTLPVTFTVLFLGGDRLNITRYSPKKTRRVDWVSGACIMTSKIYFDRLNGFDEKIFMYMEEVDLLYRAKAQNLATYFYPEAHFIHYGSGSSNRTYPVQQLFRGLLYFYRKYSSPPAVFLLRSMLQLKALVAVAIGRATKNEYLINTYGKAFKIAQMD